MRQFIPPALIVLLAVLAPVVPFVLWGKQLETAVEARLTDGTTPAAAALLTAGVLATDIVLPVPSSLVNTWAGAQAGVLLGTLAAWTGMTVGAALGLGLARRYGRPLAQRWTNPAELAALDRAAARWGWGAVVLTRPLPVVAEATLLLLGATRVDWRPLLAAAALSNLAIAAVYALVGSWARTEGALGWALLASGALPLAVSVLVRRAWRSAARSAPAASES